MNGTVFSVHSDEGLIKRFKQITGVPLGNEYLKTAINK